MSVTAPGLLENALGVQEEQSEDGDDQQDVPGHLS
jgi:hypothetical protein